MGHDVAAVHNGWEALEAVEGGGFDLVLMDCQMPELDGYEAARRIREGPEEIRRIPIVALTAHAMREDLDRCLAVGMNDYITKPFLEEVLRRKLEHWLDGGTAETGKPASAPTPAPRRPARRSPADLAGIPGTASLGIHRVDAGLRRQEALRASPDGPRPGPGRSPRAGDDLRSETHLEEMRAGLLRGDRSLVEWQAHSLEGSSAVLGALRLEALCAELEELPFEASYEICAARIAGIEEEYTRVLSGLDAAAEKG